MSHTMTTHSETRIAKLEARIAELETDLKEFEDIYLLLHKENEKLKLTTSITMENGDSLRRVYISMYTPDDDNGRQLKRIKWVGEVDKSMTPKEIFEFAKKDGDWDVIYRDRVWLLDADEGENLSECEICSTYLILDKTEDEESIPFSEKEYDLKTHKEIVEGEGYYDCGCYYKEIRGAPFMCDKHGYDYRFHDKNGHRTGSEILYKKNEDGEWCENYVCKECVDDWKEQGAREEDEFTDDEDE